MRHPLSHRAAGGVRLRNGFLLAGVAWALGCDSSTAPRTRLVTVCVWRQWLAYQNDGAEWVHLESGTGRHTLRVTERLAFAQAHFQESPPASHITVDWLTADQLVARFRCESATPGPSGMVGGSVAGLPNFQWATVYYNGIGAYVPTGYSTWQMEAQRVPAPLVAVRYDSGQASVAANRVILRHDQSYLSGTPVPLLDFDSGEAFAPQVNTVSFTGPRAWATVYFLAAGREAFLSTFPVGPLDNSEMARTAPIYSIPTARMGAGDIHVMNLGVESRTSQHYFRAGSDHAMTVGPLLATPTLTTVATTPYRRMRVEVQSQVEYGASVNVMLGQYIASPPRSSRIELTATREYFGGTPATWSLTVPDFSSIPGFQLTGLLAGGEVGWWVWATNRRFDFSPLNAQDGEMVFHASANGTSP